VNLFSRLYYRYKKILKTLRLYLLIAGPGIIVMVADNDAGGITTYTVTGAQFSFHLIWFLILLGPVAYYVQEMTVRLGAVTKRGHAEAIFHAFGSFWGWFSLLDLVLVNWLTMITEFVGMTAAMSIFHVPPLVTVIVAWIIMGTMVLQGRYWTWEKLALIFCGLNLIYIPAAFLINPPIDKILYGSLIPHFPPGLLKRQNQITFLVSHAGRKKCFAWVYTPVSRRMISRRWRCRIGRCGSTPPGAAGPSPCRSAR
jgi:Mn2+/Fe2+ NRAMP family transporter